MTDSAFDKFEFCIESINEFDNEAKRPFAGIWSLISQESRDTLSRIEKLIRKMKFFFKRLKISKNVFLYGIYFGVFLVLKLILTTFRELTQCVFYVKYKELNELILKIKSICRLRYESKPQYLYANNDVDLEGVNV